MTDGRSASNTSRFALATAALVAAAAFAVACTQDKHKEPNVELIQDMMDQPAIKAQDYDPSHPEQAGSRLPPEGTVPTDYAPYPYHNDPTGAEKLKNPLAGDMKPATLAQGQKRFETFCTPCHGTTGKGDGTVAPKMVLKPANLVGNKVIVDKSDAHYFHTITDGYGGMGSYGGQIPSEHDRWAIVNYVRSLQKLAGPAGAPAGSSAAAGAEKKR